MIQKRDPAEPVVSKSAERILSWPSYALIVVIVVVVAVVGIVSLFT